MASSSYADPSLMPIHKSAKKSTPSFSKEDPKFVTIIVSKASNEKKFVVDKELICYHSPFFNSTFNGNFVEGQTQTMHLDDVDGDRFGQLNHWLYTQQIETKKLTDLLLLDQVWVLAERALMPALQNSALDTIYTILQGTIIDGDKNFKALLDLVYTGRQEQYAMLRSLLVDYFASASSQRIDGWTDHLPQKLWVELTKALIGEREVVRDKGGRAIDPKNAADYHVKMLEEQTAGVVDSSGVVSSTSVQISRLPEVRSEKLSRLEETILQGAILKADTKPGILRPKSRTKRSRNF